MSKNLKLKNVIKSFVPEPISCFSDSYMFMNICERFPYLYEYVYFTYPYHGYVIIAILGNYLILLTYIYKSYISNIYE